MSPIRHKSNASSQVREYTPLVPQDEPKIVHVIKHSGERSIDRNGSNDRNETSKNDSISHMVDDRMSK